MILREDFFCNLETIPRSNEVNKLILIFTVHSNFLANKLFQEAWLTPSYNNTVQVRYALIGTTNGEILTTRTLPQNGMYLLENTRTVLIMGNVMALATSLVYKRYKYCKGICQYTIHPFRRYTCRILCEKTML